jgi:predicted SAM-dependent methyltransferase
VIIVLVIMSPGRTLLDRVERLLSGVDVHKEVGLEIGPLDKPLVKRTAGRSIFYADYTSREVLQQNSADDENVNVDNIPHIDYVINGSLPKTLDRQFDYVVASHVAEHVPDFLGWVLTMFGWLKPGGRIILAIPDKRYCFDFLRTPSSVGQLLEAFFERRPYPKLSAIYDGMRQAVRFDTWRAWNEPDYQGPFEPIFSPEVSLYTARRALEAETYQDCHCWVFTHQTFLDVINEINSLGVAPITIIRHEAPVHGSNEFHVVLEPKRD